MKTKILATSSAILLTVIFVATASAQNWKVAANIPFSFNVGKQEMRSGRYTVNILGQSLLIQSEDHKATVISLANSMYTPPDLKGATLVFNLYGNQYFLSSVSWPEGPSRILPPASVELELRKVAAHRRFVIAAR